MSAKPIAVGDLVMVAYGLSCCGRGYKFGYTFIVDSFKTEKINYDCTHCGVDCGKPTVALEAGDPRGFTLDRLIRIDPSTLPESVNQEQEIHA